MSWEIINEAIGLAVVDPDFCQRLLCDPLVAMQRHGFQLTQEEIKVLSEIEADNLVDFVQDMLTRLAPPQL